MPAAWSRKDERQYKAIVKSCVRRRGVKVCKRIAAATVNKRRRAEGRTFGDFVIEARRRSANDPETGGWAPGWAQAGQHPTRDAAEQWVRRRGLRGARYRIKARP